VNKFGRVYELRVEATGGGPDVIIRLPFTVEFDVQRHRFSSATISTIRIYNLSETTRAKLRKNQVDFALKKTCTFRAGYGDQLSTLLTGNVMMGFSVREGNNYITTLQIFDGGFAFANASILPSKGNYAENTPYRNVAIDLIKSLKDFGVSLGSVGTLNGDTGRGLSLTGSTTANLKEITEGKFFIDNGVGHCLEKFECVPAPLKKLNSSSGLLGTPVRELTYLDVELIFEPSILCGQKLEIDSTTGKNFNGVYQVISLRHRGIISESVNGECTTGLTLVFGIGNLIDVIRST